MAGQNKNTQSKAKKIAIIIIAIILSIGLLVIVGTVAIGATIMDRLFPNIALNKQAEKNFEYLKKQNTAKLIKQFSDDAKNNHDLNQEFADFYSNVDGKLISYDRVNCTDGEQYVDGGKVTKHRFTCEYRNIKTDTGASYEFLSYTFYKINDYYPSAVGINTLVLRDDEELVVGLQGEDFGQIQQ